jgi:HPt (histidine-containing phosphotransfer) domain-containing protein
MVQEKAYDLIFMDHMMPEMDGVETTFKIRSLAGEPFRKLPIIALTANAVSGMKEMFLANGFNDFLAKPIEKNKLEEILLRWLPREKQTFTESPGAAPAPGPQSLPEIPGLDTVRGLAMTGGQKEGYLKILKIFVDDARQYLKLLKEALDKGDWPKFTIEVHALKSSASTVGAVALSESARKLEEAGRAIDEPFVDLNFEIFHEDMLLLLTRLEHYLGGLSVSARGQSFLSPTEIVGELKALRRAFDETDGGAIDSIITRLSEERLNEELRQDVDRLARHFLEVEYDEAIALIDILINGYQDDRS